MNADTDQQTRKREDRKQRPKRGAATRAQTELPAIAIAFVLLTAVLVLSIAAANTALSSAERPAVEQQAAVGLSEQLTAESAAVTTRPNVLDPDAVTDLTASDLESTYGLLPAHDVRVQLDGETIVESGDPSGGTTIDRLVVLESRSEQTLEPSFEGSRSVTLPRRTPSATIDIDTAAETKIRSVRANNRVLLWNDSGLDGEFELSLSRFETQRLSFEAAGLLSDGSVTVTYYPAETRKATLTVTIDA